MGVGDGFGGDSESATGMAEDGSDTKLSFTGSVTDSFIGSFTDSFTDSFTGSSASADTKDNMFIDTDSEIESELVNIPPLKSLLKFPFPSIPCETKMATRSLVTSSGSWTAAAAGSSCGKVPNGFKISMLGPAENFDFKFEFNLTFSISLRDTILVRISTKPAVKITQIRVCRRVNMTTNKSDKDEDYLRLK